MRDFQLEVYFSQWEFSAQYHMTASDMQSMSLKELLSLASDEEREQFDNLWLGYTETWGAPVLRERIAETYEQMQAENILCFAGAEEGIYAAMRVLLNRQDHAIVVTPNYQAAETLPLDICDVSGVALQESRQWQLDVDEIAAAIKPNTRLISINVPNNPTGATLSRNTLDALVALCRKHDLYLFSDEVYRGLELDESRRTPQIADVYEKGFSLNVLSKAYGFPGLRVGWMASRDREQLVRMERYKHYLSICNSAPSEQLTMIVLRNRGVILQRNRALLTKNLATLREFFADFPELFRWSAPDGGCIAYPRFLGRGGVEAFCRRLVEKHGVLLLPASIYRSELTLTPEEHFRIGFGRSHLAEGLLEFRTFLEQNKQGLMR